MIKIIRKNTLLLAILFGLNIISCKNFNTNESNTQKPLITRDQIISNKVVDQNGKEMLMTFDNSKSIVTVEFNGEKIELVSKNPASGIWYTNDNYELRGKGEHVELLKNEKIIFQSK